MTADNRKNQMDIDRNIKVHVKQYMNDKHTHNNMYRPKNGGDDIFDINEDEFDNLEHEYLNNNNNNNRILSAQDHRMFLNKQQQYITSNNKDHM